MISGQLKDGTTCPTCNRVIDGYSAEHSHRPEPKDITMCMYCGEGLVFTDNLGVRKLEESSY